MVLLSGSEDGLRVRGLHALLKAADPDGGLELENLEAGQHRPDAWLASAGTAPFLSERRTVVVRHLLRASPEDTRSSAPSSGAGRSARRRSQTCPTSYMWRIWR